MNKFQMLNRVLAIGFIVIGILNFVILLFARSLGAYSIVETQKGVLISMAVIGLLIWIGTKRKWWGTAYQCPKCGQERPLLRIPKSWSRALQGGWTCKKCGAEIDQWGKLKEKF